ncbi:aminoglycoside phosphotransferase family protein [Fictibacillus phosphorivorans]|uniref:aminoglycoside phosphotransferase family protein n=1 Tax=Fictibacillus phosphorivorans TaxID=1221500 RepID=UPI00129388DB|nr:aminoglycoside phosphotransferase family protein [Fictibacillus phosphorivorans]MQR96192.1 hydrogenase expression protein HypB [Fictibacillus phosphorivorans]
MSYKLPDLFIKQIIGVHGEKASEWLSTFKDLLSYCEKNYDLHIQPPFNLSYNFVAPATRSDGSEMVLKVVIDQKEYETELSALQLLSGENTVKLLEYEKERGLMLLERIQPGHTLAEIEDDDEATVIAAKVIKKLMVPAPAKSNLPTVLERENSLKRIYQNYDDYQLVSQSTIEQALSIFRELNRSIEEPYILHGDLHHYNILANGDGSWTAIDPKGLIGDREYEVVQYLLNKLPEHGVEEITEKRIGIFVDVLNLNKDRVLLRAYSHAVLATCWTIEDGHVQESFLNIIQVFKNLVKKYIQKDALL